MKKAIFILLMLSILFSCGGKKKQGLTEEQQEEEIKMATVFESEEVMDTVIPAKGVKYRGTRAVDAANPPVKLNLAGAGKEDKNLDIGDYYSKVKYVKLKHSLPADRGGFLGDAKVIIIFEKGMSSMRDANSRIFLAGDKIVAGDDFFGYHCYDKDGRFEYTIVARDIMPDYNQKSNEVTLDFSTSSESIMHFSVLDNNCFYYAVKNNKPRMYFHNIERRKNYLERPGWCGQTSLYNPTTIACYTYGIRNPNRAPVFRVFDYKGDTLSVFMNNNPLVTPQKKANTNPDSPFIYHYDNKLTIRQAYNDTIYRMVSEKELRPVYVMDFGSQKLDVETGLYGDKSNKLIPNGWIETADFALLTYTKDYDCPNNRNNGNVVFNYVYYDKATKKLYNIPTHSFPEECLISNSIEGGIPLIANNMKSSGKLLYTGYTKPQLESIIKHKDFSSLPQAQQDKLNSLNQDLDAQEMLVMILE